MSKPIAIIAMLEDCPPQLDRKLINTYWDTNYWLEPLILEDQKPLLFRLDGRSEILEQHLEQFDIQTFAIITAFNPGSRLLPETENLRRNAALYEMLRVHCPQIREAKGQSVDETWAEASFWALNIDLAVAAELGRVWEQLAIVCWKKDAQGELWCL
jgi:Protein of unknown function (DUF3293)